MKKFTILILILTIFSSCDTIRVSSDYNENVDFSNLKTYAFSKAMEANRVMMDRKGNQLSELDLEILKDVFEQSSVWRRDSSA